MPTRYRADLADVAWGKEFTYGVIPPASELDVLITGTASTATASKAGMLRGQWGLVTGGIDLPTPTYDWQPFFGLGVMNRNMLFPIQGRERLEGRISQTLLCHESSRLFLEQMIGLAFNAKNADAGAAGDVNTYGVTSGTATIAATTFSVAGENFDYANTVGSAAPTHIVIVSDVNNTPPNRIHDTWAYIGPNYAGDAFAFQVFKDPSLAAGSAGWNGVRPPDGANTKFSIHGIKRANSTGITAGTSGQNSTNVENVTRDSNVGKHIFIRPTLVQPSFTLGARFRADDGSSFITNYSGCKVSRAVFNFEEGQPVNFGADFIARDMSHSIGQHDGTGNAEDTLKYKAEVALGGTPTSANTVGPNYMKDVRITEQPYLS